LFEVFVLQSIHKPAPFLFNFIPLRADRLACRIVLRWWDARNWITLHAREPEQFRTHRMHDLSMNRANRVITGARELFLAQLHHTVPYPLMRPVVVVEQAAEVSCVHRISLISARF